MNLPSPSPVLAWEQNTFFEPPDQTHTLSRLSSNHKTDSKTGPVLGTSLNTTQLALLRAQIKTAHDKGIKVRYWDQPGWPISTRDGIWRQLWTEGADLINADDVEAAAGFGDAW